MSGKKILHIMPDEKFNDMAIRQFEAVAAGMNEYMVTSGKLVLTKSPLACCCRNKDLLSHVRKPEVSSVIFHGLPRYFYRLLPKIPSDKRVVWLGWGYDYYYIWARFGENAYLLPETKLLAGNSNLSLFVKKLLNIVNKPQYLQRIDYFSPVLDLEFDLMLRHFPLRARYIEWNYGSAEDDLSMPGNKFTTGKNILAGNSALATNNHVELFREIRAQVDLTGRKVIVPLSYGDADYRDKVIGCGREILGEAFEPLVDFMPKDKYLEIIKTCGFVVMNHLRQQAVGNVCMAMLLGAKVYLNERNPLFEWLRARGAFFGSVNMLDMQSLSVKEQDYNSRCIYSHWSRDAQYYKTRRLVETVLEEAV